MTTFDMASKFYVQLDENSDDNIYEPVNWSDDAYTGIKRTTTEETVTFWNSNLTHVHTVNDTRLKDDTNPPSITGMCMLDSDQIVLCDNANVKLKFLDDGATKVKYDTQCESAPFDIAQLDEIRVVATMPETKKLQFVIFKPGVKLDNKVDVNGECYGITVHASNIYICLAEKGIRILSDTGILQSSIPVTGCTVPKYICVNADASMICHSGGSGREAYASFMTNGWHGLAKITDDLMSPAGLSMDTEGNIVILDIGTNRIYAIHNSGKGRRWLLTKGITTASFSSICYSYRKGKLIVALAPKLKVYQLEKHTKSRKSMLDSFREKLKKM